MAECPTCRNDEDSPRHGRCDRDGAPAACDPCETCGNCLACGAPSSSAIVTIGANSPDSPPGRSVLAIDEVGEEFERLGGHFELATRERAQ